MTDKGRYRARQLVGADVSVDSQSTHCCYQHKNTNRETAQKETIVIVTDKLVSAVNCPIKVEIVPFSWSLKRFLLISQSTHCHHQPMNTNRETAQTLSLALQVRHRTIGVAANTEGAATEILCLASRRLPTTETSQRLVQRSRVGRVQRLSRNNDEPDLQGKEIHRVSLPCAVQKNTEQSASRTLRRAHTAPSRTHTTTSHANSAEQGAHAINSAPPHDNNKQNKTKQKSPLSLLWRCSTRCQQTRANDDASARTHTSATMPMT